MARTSTIELVVTDIDGTLVPIGLHEPSPVVRATMCELHEADVAVAAATARPYEAARELFTGLGFTGLSIFDGGASIRDVESGELRWQKWLTLPRLRQIAASVLPRAEMVDFFPGYKILPARSVSAASLADPAPYAWAMVNEAALDGLVKELQKLPSLAVYPGVGHPDKPGLIDIQITDAGANKFHALAELRKILGVPVDRTLAIGDSGNDVPLFENAGTRIAMDNAIPELKALAHHTVGRVEDDGWAEAMHRFVLA